MKKSILVMSVLLVSLVYGEEELINRQLQDEASALIHNEASSTSYRLYKKLFASKLPESRDDACDGLSTNEKYNGKSPVFIGASMGLVEGLNRGCILAYDEAVANEFRKH